MKAPLSRMPAFPAAAGMCIGIASAQVGLAAACIAACAVLFIILYFYKKHYVAYFAVMALAGAAIAYARMAPEIPQSLCGREVEAYGKLVSITQRAESQKYVVEIDSIAGHSAPFPFKCVFFSSAYHPGVEQGADVRFKGTFSQVRQAKGVPYDIDYNKYLKFEGISATASVFGTIEVASQPSPWNALVNYVRDIMYNGIVDSPINGDTASFLLAVILGDDCFISNDMRQTYRDTGLSHMLALSGLHVGLMAAMLSFLMFPLNLSRRGFLIKPVVIILLVWMYAIIVGLGASVTRAAAMITAFLLARILQRDAHPFNSLCVAAVIVLMINPFSLFTPGFQMSFAAVASILMFGNFLPNSLRRRPVAWYLANLAVMPVAAMLGTGIVAAYYFHAFPVSFLITNVVAGLLFPWLLGIGIALMVITMCGMQATWLGWLANGLYWLMSVCTNWIQQVSPGPVGGLFFSAWAILPYAIFLFFLARTISLTIRREEIWPLTAKGAWVVSALAFCVFICFIWFLRPSVPTTELYLPSGNPAGIIIRHGHSAYAMPLDQSTDRQQFFDSYNNRFGTYLASRGCKEFVPLPDEISVGPIYKNGNSIVAGDKLLCIVNSNALPTQKTKTTYALVANGYKLSAGYLQECVNVDSVLICQGVNGQRAKRLVRECGDSIPVRNLRGTTFSLIWP